MTTKSAVAQSAVQELIKELPECSVLRADLDHGSHGNGLDETFMQKMRQEGVKRAYFKVAGVLRHDRLGQAHIITRLYFREFDGPNSQITKKETLEAIEDRGLQRELDQVSLARASTAPLFSEHDPWSAFGLSKRVVSFIEFFSNPWLPEQRSLLFHSPHAAPLIGAVVSGDAIGTDELIKKNRFAKKELDRALFDATISRYDNTAVIKLLLDAGADVNARGEDGITPLMNAAAHPCNIPVLLESGADVTARDKWGRNALQLAREQNVAAAVRLLEQAGAERNKIDHQQQNRR